MNEGEVVLTCIEGANVVGVLVGWMVGKDEGAGVGVMVGSLVSPS